VSSGSKKVPFVLGLVAVAGAGSVFALRHDDAGDGERAARHPTADATAAVPAGPAAVDTRSLEPGPDVPVATDVPRGVAAGSATVVLTFVEPGAGGVEAAGFVAGVVESDGTCTLTLRRGTDSVSVHSPGEADATTTICGGLTIGADELTPGSWEAVLSYEDGTASGTSSSTAVEVPAR
jgi:hypothetical protein